MTTILMADRVSRRSERKTVHFQGIFVWIVVFYLQHHFSTHMHFTTNGYKRFSKTDTTDPRQRVPFRAKIALQRRG